MWIGVLWAGLRVAMWIAHVGGKCRHSLLEKSLIWALREAFPCLLAFFFRPTNLGHPQTCVYPDVCLGIAHVSGKVPLSGQGKRGRYTMYLPSPPQGI